MRSVAFKIRDEISDRELIQVPGECIQRLLKQVGFSGELEVPFTASKRRAFPPADPRRQIGDFHRAQGPARVVDRVVTLTDHDERLRRVDENKETEDQQGNPIHICVRRLVIGTAPTVIETLERASS